MQEQIIRTVQSWHSPLLDQLMLALSWLGIEDFYILFGPIIFWCVGARVGTRLLIVLLSSFYLSDLLKSSFDTVRPVVAHPDWVRLPEGAAETAIDEGGLWTESMPSGHAQNSVVFWGFVAQWLRERWAWAAALALIFLISLSRIYLGVHWPVDVLVGWAVGAALLGTLVAGGMLAVWSAERTRLLALVGGGLLGLLLLVIDQDVDRAKPLGFWIGAMFGLAAQQRYVPFRAQARWGVQLVKLALGLAVLLALRSALKAVLPEDAWGQALRYIVLGGWVALGAPALFRAILGPPAQQEAL